MTAVRPYEVALLVPLWFLTAHTARRALRGRARPDSGPARLLAGTVALITLSVTVGVPWVRRAIDTATGVRSVTALLGHLLGVCAITCLTGFVRQVSAAPGPAPGRGPRAWVPLAVVVAVMCGAFLPTARPDGEQDLLTHSHSAAQDVFWAVFLGYVVWGVLAVGLMCLRYHKQAPPGPLRTSLNLIGSGAATGLVYAVHRGAHLALRGSGNPLFADAAVVPVTQALLTGALLLATAGIVWPALAEHRRARTDRRRLRRLEPLWRMLGDAVPDVVLPLPDALRAEPELLLYRYAVEISDAMLALGPFRCAGVEAAARERLAAHGFTGARLAAATEAVVLRSAIGRASRARTARHPAGQPEPPGGRTGPEDPLPWLELLAAHCRHPLVDTVYAGVTAPADR